MAWLSAGVPKSIWSKAAWLLSPAAFSETEMQFLHTKWKKWKEHEWNDIRYDGERDIRLMQCQEPPSLYEYYDVCGADLGTSTLAFLAQTRRTSSCPDEAWPEPRQIPEEVSHWCADRAGTHRVNIGDKFGIACKVAWESLETCGSCFVMEHANTVLCKECWCTSTIPWRVAPVRAQRSLAIWPDVAGDEREVQVFRQSLTVYIHFPSLWLLAGHLQSRRHCEHQGQRHNGVRFAMTKTHLWIPMRSLLKLLPDLTVTFSWVWAWNTMTRYNTFHIISLKIHQDSPEYIYKCI